jgi:FkbM family methyltransferase
VIVETLKRSYWKKRERHVIWRRQFRPVGIRRRTALCLHAWRHPVVAIEGIKPYQRTGMTIPVLESFKAKRYETPEARIVSHALQTGDIVLELGPGLGFISSFCAKRNGGDNVHSFEANPMLWRVILKNYQLNAVSPRLEIALLGEKSGVITFYVMKNFRSSSTIKRHPSAKSIQIPMKSFNDEPALVRPSFLIIDIEGGERDFVRYARLEGVRKLCIELHPPVTGSCAIGKVKAFFISQGFRDEPAVSDTAHKLSIWGTCH